MKVTFKAAQVIGGKSYKKGSQQVPDRLFYHAKFKKLVKSGAATVSPRGASEITGRVSKDAFAAHAAQKMVKNAKPESLEAHEAAKAAFAKKAS